MARPDWPWAAGRDPEPTAALLDGQSVKSTDVGGTKGYDAGKKINGRKRHLLVDVMGFILVVMITAGSVQDRDGAVPVLHEAHREYPTRKRVWVDSLYNGRVIDDVEFETGITIEMVKRSDDMKGFVVLPKRWCVERTFGRSTVRFEPLPELTALPLALAQANTVTVMTTTATSIKDAWGVHD